MLGSIYIALSGMNAYSQGLQTISNNVANLDTLGYKAQTVSFEDVFNEGGAGLAYSEGEGQSVGDGVSYGRPQIDFTQGTLEQTGGNLDMAVQGNGFLVLQDTSGNTFYASTGQFSVDPNGYISDTVKGYRLTVLNASNQPTPVDVSKDETNPPVATTTITMADNLSSSATSGASVSNITVYDASGASHVWKASLAPASSGTSGQWTVTVTDENNTTVGTGTIQFNGGVIDSTQSKVTINTAYSGAAATAVTLDFSSVTSFATGATSTLQTSKVDGNASGSLTSITVNSNGQLVANYSNSQTTVLGSVAIADFQNPQQLQQVGSGMFKNAGNGAYQLQSSGEGGGGTLESGQVEASNVNLTTEFGDLILIQRGFDASSQIVSATNDMIQDLFGLRGHG